MEEAAGGVYPEVVPSNGSYHVSSGQSSMDAFSEGGGAFADSGDKGSAFAENGGARSGAFAAEKSPFRHQELQQGKQKSLLVRYQWNGTDPFKPRTKIYRWQSGTWDK